MQKNKNLRNRAKRQHKQKVRRNTFRLGAIKATRKFKKALAEEKELKVKMRENIAAAINQPELVT